VEQTVEIPRLAPLLLLAAETVSEMLRLVAHLEETAARVAVAAPLGLLFLAEREISLRQFHRKEIMALQIPAVLQTMALVAVAAQVLQVP
jgi:hypothetical protein